MKKMSSKYANYENMKANLPSGLVQAAAKGPEHVQGKTFDSVSSGSSSEAGGTEMQTGQVSWASEDDCSACSSFPGLKVGWSVGRSVGQLVCWL